MLELYQRASFCNPYSGKVSEITTNSTLSSRDTQKKSCVSDLGLRMSHYHPSAAKCVKQTAPYTPFHLRNSATATLLCRPPSFVAYRNGYGCVPTNSASSSHPPGIIVDVRRKNASRESTSTLKSWLFEHRKNPYPTKAEKIMLAIITKMTLTQVSTWFANARRRLKKENKNGEWGLKDSFDIDDEEDDENLSVSCNSESMSRSMPRSRVASVGTCCGSDNTPKLTNTETVDEGSAAKASAVVSSTTTSKHKLWSVDDMVSTSTKTDERLASSTHHHGNVYSRYVHNISAASAAVQSFMHHHHHQHLQQQSVELIRTKDTMDESQEQW